MSRKGRPDESSLKYTPLTGPNPVRPKPRDPAGVKALQAELESAGAKNLEKAKGLITESGQQGEADQGWGIMHPPVKALHL